MVDLEPIGGCPSTTGINVFQALADMVAEDAKRNSQ